MAERGILFNGEMVRAILDGRKTVTRRSVKLPRARDSFVLLDHGSGWWPYQSDDGESEFCADGMEHPYTCPYGKPGDRLWVRETWASGATQTMYRAGCNPDYRPPDGKWRPSIHMPRWASRILLEVTDVRVERLQEITEEQARAEGVTDGGCTSCGNSEPCGCDNPSPSAVDSFYHLWNSTGGDWDANPWVWVIEFKRIEQ